MNVDVRFQRSSAENILQNNHAFRANQESQSVIFKTRNKTRDRNFHRDQLFSHFAARDDEKSNRFRRLHLFELITLKHRSENLRAVLCNIEVHYFEDCQRRHN